MAVGNGDGSASVIFSEDRLALETYKEFDLEGAGSNDVNYFKCDSFPEDELSTYEDLREQANWLTSEEKFDAMYSLQRKWESDGV
jgi:hypothetical protein